MLITEQRYLGQLQRQFFIVPIFQVDQLFSILTTQFKTEIQTPEHLLSKIENSSITPKPIVVKLLFTWNWRDDVIPKLRGRRLKNHSFQHSFVFKKERGKSLMRAKKYPQHTEWHPTEGIVLLKVDQEVAPVPLSPFRTEQLNLTKVFADLVTKYFPTLDGKNRSEVEKSWERTLTELENLQKKIHNFPKMNLLSLPRQTDVPVPVYPSFLEPFLEAEERELQGQKCVEDASDGDFSSEILTNMDVVVYSEVKANRPWLGRVRRLLPETREFEIQWYCKRGRSLVFQPSVTKDDETPFLSILSVDTVMYWEFTEKSVEDESFKISREWYEKIINEYNSHDQCNI